jgi:hypothetical protein
MKMYSISSSFDPKNTDPQKAEWYNEFNVKAINSLQAAYKYAEKFGYLIHSEVTKDPTSHTGKMYKISNTDQSIRYDYVKVKPIHCLV